MHGRVEVDKPGADPGGSPKRFLVAVLTKNDELQIEGCLESARGLDADLLVVDSGPTDSTVDIARRLGAEVVHYDYITEARSRNWVLENWGRRYEWVVFLDSDERLSPELRDEIASLPRPDAGPKEYYMCRHMFFLGKRLRFGGHQEVWVLHVLHAPACKVVELTRTLEYVRVDGDTAKLHHPLIHDNKKGLSDWTRKHDFYAVREAEDRLRGVALEQPVTEGRLRALFTKRSSPGSLLSCWPQRSSCTATSSALDSWTARWGSCITSCTTCGTRFSSLRTSTS